MGIQELQVWVHEQDNVQFNYGRAQGTNPYYHTQAIETHAYQAVVADNTREVDKPPIQVAVADNTQTHVTLLLASSSSRHHKY